MRLSTRSRCSLFPDPRPLSIAFASSSRSPCSVSPCDGSTDQNSRGGRSLCWVDQEQHRKCFQGAVQGAEGRGGERRNERGEEEGEKKREVR
eukprot:767359-Hanusia_phi.AAC.1